MSDPAAKPTIGRIVVFRAAVSDYDVPAIVTATAATLPVGELDMVPGLSSDTHVHLTVFTPRGSMTDFLVEPGTYAEYNVPFDPREGPGTWRWPTIP